MTALCGGGASQLKAGYAGQTVFSASLITGAVLFAAPWLFPFAALLDTFTYEALTECTADPPALPVFNAGDLLALGAPFLNPSDTIAAVGKINDLVLIWAWHFYCECVVGPQPAPLAVQAPPAGVSTPAGNTASPCFVGIWNGQPQQFVGFGVETQNVQPLTPSPATIDENESGQLYQSFACSAGQYTKVHIELDVTWPAGATQDVGVTLYQGNAGNVLVANPVHALVHHPGATDHASFDLAVNNTAVFLCLAVGEVADAHAPTLAVTATWSCSSVACCTDPQVYQLLANIWQAVRSLSGSFPAAPSSFAVATVHAGLVGSGSFALGIGVLAVKVAITSAIPPEVGLVAGDPQTLVGAGWITYESGGDPFPGQRLTYNGQLFLSPASADACHYTLAPGIIATLTELTAGP